jgi:hypothetical protein
MLVVSSGKGLSLVEIEREVCLWGDKPQKFDENFGPLNPGIPPSAPGYFNESE